MRLQKLKNNLEKKVKAKNSSNVRFVKNKIQTINNELSNLDKMKIIGITGSTGKSTTAYIVHKYLKSCGYRSILYSSVMIDSPASIIDPNESCEVSIYNEEDLLSIINEAESYNTEYLVLEINESILEKKIVKDLPFNIRVLTNINPYHNEEQYTNDEYVNIKKSFFRDIMEEDCHCIIGLEDNKELFNEFLNLNNLRKSTFSSRYISNKKILILMILHVY